MSIFFEPRKVYWHLNSKTDPRWDCSGSYMGFVTSAQEVIIDPKVAELKNKLGEPPEDLTFSCMKE